MNEFQRDPLRFLNRTFSGTAETAWVPERQLFLADASASRAVLANAEELYEEHSDFFHTGSGTFGPRSQQVAIGRAAMILLNTYRNTHRDGLPAAIERELVPRSSWPDAGNWLVYHHLAPALIHPSRPERLRRTVDGIIERSVLAGARDRGSRIGRAVYRMRTMWELVRAVERTREDATPPKDVLSAVVQAADPEVDAGELTEVFLSFVFAAGGSVGFTLGWSLYLLGTHPEVEAEPGWVVREALRLWPVAWLLGRRPARPHRVAEVEVTPGDDVVVCPYAVHRNPQHWEDPHSFRPERWGGEHDPKAFLPFGWGPHRCVAANFSMRLVEDILRLLAEGYRMTFECEEKRPQIGAALAPPRFTLGLKSLTEGGEGHGQARERRQGGFGCADV